MAFLTTALLSAVLAAPPSDEWRPAETWAVVVGVLSWQEESWSSFSDERRQDALLYELLRERGMPEERGALLLDEAATRANIEAALTAKARAAEPGSTFVFYYAGHGQRVSPSEYYFANYDMSGPASGLSVDRIGEILRRNFRGRRVLLFADCCHSGSLRRVVDQLAMSGVEAACVTSVVSQCVSTGNWTFTQTLLEGLRGDPTLDEDGDGAVRLSELAEGVFEAMACREEQKSGYSAEGLSPDFALAASAGRPAETADARYGEHVRVAGGRARAAKVVGIEGDTLRLRLYSYSDSQEREVEAASCTLIEDVQHGVGTTVQRQGRAAAGMVATVLRHHGPFHWLEYRDFPDREGEWVHGRLLRPSDAPPDPNAVLVEWRGTWYPATVLETDGERSKIHYLGYDSSWDEWVGPERIRRPRR